MTIRLGSRFAKSTVRRITQNGVTRDTIDTRIIKRYQYEDASVHTVVEGDRLDQLASRYYGNSKYWWIIADANPSVIFPLDLVEGSQIVIPPESVLINI